MQFVIVDATGEELRSLWLSNEEDLESNVAEGETLVEGTYPGNAYWNGTAWITKPASPGTWAIWDTTAKVWVDPRSLDDLKVTKRAELQAMRDAAIGGGVTWDGDVFQSDLNSRLLISGAVQMASLAMQAGESYSDTWILTNNEVRELDGSEIIALGLALGQSIKTNFGKFQALQAAIAAATTEQELEAITWYS